MFANVMVGEFWGLLAFASPKEGGGRGKMRGGRTRGRRRRRKKPANEAERDKKKGKRRNSTKNVGKKATYVDRMSFLGFNCFSNHIRISKIRLLKDVRIISKVSTFIERL